jgi:hypothetical protein
MSATDWPRVVTTPVSRPATGRRLKRQCWPRGHRDRFGPCSFLDLELALRAVGGRDAPRGSRARLWRGPGKAPLSVERLCVIETQSVACPACRPDPGIASGRGLQDAAARERVEQPPARRDLLITVRRDLESRCPFPLCDRGRGTLEPIVNEAVARSELGLRSGGVRRPFQ